MSSETFEIVELANGDVALRRAGHREDPLVRIHFSAESLEFLREHKVAVARAMLEAGIEAVQYMEEQGAEYLEEEEEAVPVNHTVH
ncbi:hypothetical protein OQJ46_04595 [Microbulbifer thermotolerans]|uniref:Uncharacterized protein n=1 Tax=Microbulbifer thermotolerans TaxID=252514 RepID=A0AB35HT72_MICTH|nr:hypothetical protein [Microbulbifer thermotolerans]MCX2779797.1 hypothetical protein [Microbulbifer thermotolerans]MCX2782271.1 hypothetical protein [Microbulbifer thermotolerans]MCX2794465.1 hypothetical protein [Microbulbifer thermotolerans]MCX2800424.1 hypothetical protein [Microbulbifer thermotolerans]MCX2805032.1 hypothetical protein [Microbulbifer thermotolerans]